ATSLELDPLLAALPESENFLAMLSGVGPVEATWGLTAFISRQSKMPRGVINFGVCGAYPDTGLDLLDLCLAEEEVLGDLGIVHEAHIEPLAPAFAPPQEFACDPSLLAAGAGIFKAAGLPCHRGRFVTVSGGSGTRRRGEYLRDSQHAVCENMEGAAMARVCRGFGVPFLELRCVSNLVLDRAERVWRAKEAALRCARAAALLVEGLNRGD
ncbi:MAG TPA: futalosine hydrolase, partial [Desulfurivibrionaceae bacterium]|nr:futalosine hydrolase [Desulfurivibrionaceae bacterium]